MTLHAHKKERDTAAVLNFFSTTNKPLQIMNFLIAVVVLFWTPWMKVAAGNVAIWGGPDVR